jgi:hypothetical protein
MSIKSWPLRLRLLLIRKSEIDRAFHIDDAPDFYEISLK